ncbi:hypothetical protein BpHYR1_027836 [Brachionus plicatilis]|uniref:Uncharacterized protein n=1 Tax=Brachionus plicatilis TaxID=10195 RepID=A0A3M7RIY0_BRAPC|nr:hypothetical protein BpHYR1_027836 [Brachionus plicatilis]
MSYPVSSRTSRMAHLASVSSSNTFPLGKPQEALAQKPCTSSTFFMHSSRIMAPLVGTACLNERHLDKMSSSWLACCTRKGQWRNMFSANVRMLHGFSW